MFAIYFIDLVIQINSIKCSIKTYRVFTHMVRYGDIKLNYAGNHYYWSMYF